MVGSCVNSASRIIAGNFRSRGQGLNFCGLISNPTHIAGADASVDVFKLHV